MRLLSFVVVVVLVYAPERSIKSRNDLVFFFFSFFLTLALALSRQVSSQVAWISYFLWFIVESLLMFNGGA